MAETTYATDFLGLVTLLETQGDNILHVNNVNKGGAPGWQVGYRSSSMIRFGDFLEFRDIAGAPNVVPDAAFAYGVFPALDTDFKSTAGINKVLLKVILTGGASIDIETALLDPTLGLYVDTVVHTVANGDLVEITTYGLPAYFRVDVVTGAVTNAIIRVAASEKL
jgi:hypothetical protein